MFHYRTLPLFYSEHGKRHHKFHTHYLAIKQQNIAEATKADFEDVRSNRGSNRERNSNDSHNDSTQIPGIGSNKWSARYFVDALFHILYANITAIDIFISKDNVIFSASNIGK
uniref:Uncharacterized protein n=1 Tax=Glossina austeni TaxID=7395 RepID=A0A1A9VY65_GLOAU